MMALVLTLCRLHNFSIAEALLHNDTSTDTNDCTIELLAMDNANVVCDGAISLQDNKRPTPSMDDTIYIKIQVFRLLRYYSPAPRNIARSDWATQNITHNMTSSKT